MKKLLTSVIFFLITGFLFCAEYKIETVKYDLKSSSWGFLMSTNEYALEQKVSVDKNKIFESEEDLIKYIQDYELRIKNTRAFESVSVKTEYGKPASKESYIPVTVYVNTVDSIPVLAVPYPKYNSNDGFIFKLKIKDMNFMGSLNPMSSDINFQIDNSTSETKYTIGLTFSFDYPFKAGIFDATFVNDYTLDYTFGEPMPEWNAKTGLKFVYPKDRISFCLELYQSIINNLDYKVYDDNVYFNNLFKFSTPIVLKKMNYFGNLNYTPYISLNVNYDKDSINIANTDLLGPVLKFGHSLDFGRIDWKDNYRYGFTFNLSNSMAYNFHKERIYTDIALEAKYFNYLTYTDKISFLNRIGISSYLYTYYAFVDYESHNLQWDGDNFGNKLRGVRDTQYYSNGWESLLSPAIILLNVDFPFHLFTTNFSGKVMQYFNFDCQISPFFDMALSYNKETKTFFNPKDGFYCAGLEVLIYPAKFASFTVRASVGVDIGRKLFSDYINTSWRENVSTYEISVGIGLAY